MNEKSLHSALLPQSKASSSGLLSTPAFVVAIYAGQHLLRAGLSPHTLLQSVLAWGTVICGSQVLARDRDINLKSQTYSWAKLCTSAALQYVKLCLILFAMSQLSALRVIQLMQASSVAILNGQRDRPFTLIAGIALSLLFDIWASTGDSLRTIAGYLTVGALAFCDKWASTATTDAIQPQDQPLANFVSLASAFGLSITLGLLSFASAADHNIPLIMSVLITASLSHFLVSRSLSHCKALSKPVVTLVVALLLELLFFETTRPVVDIVVTTALLYGLYPGKQRIHGYRLLLNEYLSTILANPESRKIFYFLMLNMLYMLVQMLYGIWTNSLGLISDAIHMAFDCLAIGIGLAASVMAQWPADEKFTYGYDRIETLSGFSNGVFLILISIFIVFEAIQRLMSPPDMSTHQLLLVGTVGLMVNLFGMFAMGGHHHHGHSHSGADTHSTDHSASHSHGHSHGHEGHSHNMRGVFLHVMADTLGSIGVIVSTLLIQLYGWTGFDPIASLFIAILIAASVIPLMLDTGRILLLDLTDHISSIHHLSNEDISVYLWPKDDQIVHGSIISQAAVVDSEAISTLTNKADALQRQLQSHIAATNEVIIQLN